MPPSSRRPREAWRRLSPSTSSSEMPTGLPREDVGPGARARATIRPCFSWSIWTASSIAGRRRCPAWPSSSAAERRSGDTIIYVTNNSRWHRTEYLARLAAMGAPARLEHILTSGRGTALALAHLSRPPRRTLVFGGPGLARELEDAGLATVPCVLESLDPAPDAVVVGIDFELTHERLSVAASAIRDGALFVATNRDPVFPLPARLMAGAGALVAALVAATGREPDLVIGKPEPGLLREARRGRRRAGRGGRRHRRRPAHRHPGRPPGGRTERPAAHRGEQRGDGRRAAAAGAAHAYLEGCQRARGPSRGPRRRPSRRLIGGAGRHGRRGQEGGGFAASHASKVPRSRDLTPSSWWRNAAA